MTVLLDEVCTRCRTFPCNCSAERYVGPDQCRGCGCSTWDPCPEGCFWVENDLCSRCWREENP